MSLELLNAVPHAGEHTRVRPDATRLPARGVVNLEKICFRFQRVGPFFLNNNEFRSSDLVSPERRARWTLRW